MNATSPNGSDGVESFTSKLLKSKSKLQSIEKYQTLTRDLIEFLAFQAIQFSDENDRERILEHIYAFLQDHQMEKIGLMKTPVIRLLILVQDLCGRDPSPPSSKKKDSVEDSVAEEEDGRILSLKEFTPQNWDFNIDKLCKLKDDTTNNTTTTTDHDFLSRFVHMLKQFRIQRCLSILRTHFGTHRVTCSKLNQTKSMQCVDDYTAYVHNYFHEDEDHFPLLMSVLTSSSPPIKCSHSPKVFRFACEDFMVALEHQFPMEQFQREFLEFCQAWCELTLCPPYIMALGYSFHPKVRKAQGTRKLPLPTERQGGDDIPTTPSDSASVNEPPITNALTKVIPTNETKQRENRKRPASCSPQVLRRRKMIDYDEASKEESTSDNKASKEGMRNTNEAAKEDTSNEVGADSRAPERRQDVSQPFPPQPQTMVVKDHRSEVTNLPSVSPKRKKRQKWTDEEKMAIVEGVEQFGVGQWAVIKNEFPQQLKHRTSVQIKDCYRTMTKNRETGELV